MMANVHALDKYQLPKLEELPAPERYDEILNVIEKADTEGAIAPLPEAQEFVHSGDLFESRVLTIRTRLYLMGYLSRNNKSSKTDKKLKEAILNFQAEAGLKQDSWVGRKTWTALQELVSFEHPSNLEKWFNNNGVSPALVRAAKLRLFVLGFLPSKQSKDETKLKEALKKFSLVSGILNLHHEPVTSDLSLKTLKVLFDQDNIVNALAGMKESFTARLPNDISKKEAAVTVKRFIICCAKVELWLLGYQIPLDGNAKFVAPSRIDYNPFNYPVYHALFTFWQEQGQSRKYAQQHSEKITGHFFSALQDIQSEGESIDEPNLSEKIYQELIKVENKEITRQVWNHIKLLGSRIWDGIKRVWRWMKSLFSKIVKKLTTWAINAARLVYQYAVNAFPVLKKISKVTAATFSVLFNWNFPDSDIQHLVISRDLDFDYNLYLNPARDTKKVLQILEKLSSQTSLFNTGAQILAFLLRTLIYLIKNIAAAGGWFGLILAIVKIYPELKKLEDILDEKEAFLAVG